jgi:hypothetical protein
VDALACAGGGAGVHHDMELNLIGVRSMSEIKTALLTVRPPIRLKRELVGISSSHRLDSISNKSTPAHCLHPRFFFSIFESELKIESSLSVRDQSLLSCRTSSRSTTVNPSLARKYCTRTIRRPHNILKSSLWAPPTLQLIIIELQNRLIYISSGTAAVHRCCQLAQAPHQSVRRSCSNGPEQ